MLRGCPCGPPLLPIRLTLSLPFPPSIVLQTYPERYKDVVIPDAYERLILDCIRRERRGGRGRRRRSGRACTQTEESRTGTARRAPWSASGVRGGEEGSSEGGDAGSEVASVQGISLHIPPPPPSPPTAAQLLLPPPCLTLPPLPTPGVTSNTLSGGMSCERRGPSAPRCCTPLTGGSYLWSTTNTVSCAVLCRFRGRLHPAAARH